jgi:hypothetical protein
LGAGYGAWGGFYGYAGASLSGTIRFIESNVVHFTTNFSAKVPVPLFINPARYSDDPDTAPFGEVYTKFFLPTLLDTFYQAFGPRPLVYAYREETLRWVEHPPRDMGFTSAIGDALVKIGNPVLNDLRQVEKGVKWADGSGSDFSDSYPSWVLLNDVWNLIRHIECPGDNDFATGALVKDGVHPGSSVPCLNKP